MVETLFTILVLVVGVLGSISLIEGASGTTSKNNAREGATALQREMLDVVRSVPYSELTDSGVAAALQTRPALADASPASGYTLVRRGHVYTVSVVACSLDDPKDGTGAHDVAVTFCPDSEPAGTKDRNADDYRRVRVTLAWTRDGRSERSRQTTVITNPAGGLGPSATGLTLLSPSAPITDPDVTSAEFQATFATPPATVSWALNGDIQGAASGSGTTWTFSWQLAGWPDGTYVVQTQGVDAEGRSGVARKLTVALNRRAPAAPGGFDGGRNGNGADVDLEWLSSGDRDVVGYRVYRTDANGGRIARACPPAGGDANAYVEATSCIDTAAPTTGTLYYVAVALDMAPAGGLREGPQTAVKQVAEGNAVPTAPTGVSVCSGGAAGCTLADGTAAPAGTSVVSWTGSSDPDSGDSISFYRIYRDGTAYAARYGRVYAGSTLKFVDTALGGQSHSYRVTAVDTAYGESSQSEAASG